MRDTVLRVDATASAPALLLRPWEDGDLPSLVETYRDPELCRWTARNVSSDEDANRWLEVQRNGWRAGDRFSFAVLEEPAFRRGSRPMAHVVLKRADPAGPAAEVGYWTAAQARGRGVASRAVGALSVWAFETFAAYGLRRLDLLHQVDNAASCRVAEKCGFGLAEVLPPNPPHPLEGHLHSRSIQRPGAVGQST